MKFNDWAMLIGSLMTLVGTAVASIAVYKQSDVVFIGICVALAGVGVMRGAID